MSTICIVLERYMKTDWDIFAFIGPDVKQTGLLTEDHIFFSQILFTSCATRHRIPLIATVFCLLSETLSFMKTPPYLNNVLSAAYEGVHTESILSLSDAKTVNIF